MHVRSQPTQIRGLTLIELLVVVAIISVLATIAYPSYQQSVAKTWRGRAIFCLEELAQGMERRFTMAMSYQGAAPPVNACVSADEEGWEAIEADMATRYRFAFVGEPSTTGFTISAVPLGVQASNDAACGTLSIDQTGTKTVSGTRAVADCW